MNSGKLVDYLVAKLKVFKQQKVFSYKGYKIKYILEENKSDHLVVIFSACTRIGIKARYNYMNTLRNMKCNKLFILDDYGDDGRGVYYLGKDGDYCISDAVSKLTKHIIDKLNIETKIYVGSSKGGYAALYFGLKDKADFIISGAPQYNLGNFVNDEGGYHILKFICGDISEASVQKLNNLLRDEINNLKVSDVPKIFLHYSNEEFTYEEHVKYLKKQLDAKGIIYEENIAHYNDHSEISTYFPPFLKNTIQSIIF